jgi:uncharacterized protein (TIRG00374 family)
LKAPEIVKTPPSSSKAKVIEAAVGYAVGIACLYWLFHNLPGQQLLHSLAGVNWWFLIPCIVLALAAYLVVAWQWQLLLRPVGPFPFRRAAQAVFAGRFANDVLPLHMGYLVRAFLAARWMRVNLTAMAPALMMERLWDGVWLAAGTGVLSMTIPLSADVIRARNIFAAMVLVGVIATTAVVLSHRRHVAPAPSLDSSQSRIFIWTMSFLQSVADGIRDIVRSRVFAGVVVLALFKLAVQAVAILAMLRACGIELSLIAGLVVFVAGYLATCVPAAPAGAGLFQVFVVGVLGHFGVGKPEAATFSLVSFVTLTAPPAVAGFFALAGSGFTLRQIRGEIREQK